MHSLFKDYYRTRNLYEAAYLVTTTQKADLKPEEDRFIFEFEDKAACEKLSNQYWRGEAIVNAKAYAEAIRTLKERIFHKGALNGRK